MLIDFRAGQRTLMAQRYRENISSDIKQKIQSLQELYKRERELKEELEATRQHCQLLEQELRPYEATASINHLPPELLTCIFQLALLEDHTRIGRLLFVCRHWTQLVLHTPILWTNIHVRVQGSDKAPVKPSYVRACYARSGELPLEVLLDFALLSSPEDCLSDMRRYINKACESHCVYSGLPLSLAYGLKPACSIATKVGESIYDIMSSLAKQLALALASGHGRHMRRWSCATLLLPRGTNDYETSIFISFSKELVQKLRWKTPNLQTLRIASFSDLHPLRFPKFAGLIDLTVDDLEYVSRHPLSSSLLRLSVLRPTKIGSLTRISGLSRLEELELTLWCCPFNDRLRAPLQFECLKRLTLIGYSTFGGPIDFRIPKLDLLRIKDLCLIDFDIDIPTSTLDWWYTGMKEFDTNILTQIFTTVGSAKHLTTHGINASEVDNYLKHRMTPPTLEVVAVIENDGTLHTRKLHGSLV
ncbi:hypothetical protein PIIN_06885 [Serendipita indica DSM 11827]|uniref:F-box domain-containing protein n=1 Tax=Serendipita indica (strain DSM 11827) TaxID=1109443 RepID=G4U374_SERID|nr:hypothetical protein PIIN_06885 [Serendipita indica DSM 11827]